MYDIRLKIGIFNGRGVLRDLLGVVVLTGSVKSYKENWGLFSSTFYIKDASENMLNVIKHGIIQK